jgi:hypothetical protein
MVMADENSAELARLQGSIAENETVIAHCDWRSPNLLFPLNSPPIIMMKTQQLVSTLSLMLSLQVLAAPALAESQLQVSSTPILSQCNSHQETFAFQVPTYAIQHMGGAILNIKLAYRLTPEAIAKNDYPDFMPITKEIDHYLTQYPNETDYWEIVNKNLVQHLLSTYPQMSSLNLELGVMPTPKASFARFSTVRHTRPQGCPIVMGS